MDDPDDEPVFVGPLAPPVASTVDFDAGSTLADEADFDSDDVSAVDSFDGDEAGADADEDDPSELSAFATAGTFVTAIPMPSATANAPTRPTYFP